METKALMTSSPFSSMFSRESRSPDEGPPHHRQIKHLYPNQHSNRKSSNDLKNVGNSSDVFRLWEEGPNFDTSMIQDVVALAGKTAHLICRIIDRGNQTVSRPAY